MDIAEVTIPWSSGPSQLELFGANDEYLKIIEGSFSVSVSLRDNAIRVTGCGGLGSAESARDVLLSLIERVKGGQTLTRQSVEYLVSVKQDGQDVYGVYDDLVAHTSRGRQIRSKTYGQKRYIDAIKSNEITFAIGPAGTGKTYLAIAMAVAAFKKGDASRIVLVRPAVEAGESLGFLPGDMKEKVDPYLRPIYDALFDVMGTESYERNAARGAIEIAPLAYMRGRTLDSAFIILDEAQNTTPEQMKMFLTRIGLGSKAVVTGDVTQIDLPPGRVSGLVSVQRILQDVKGIQFVNLSKSDIVRNPLVQRIINAYELREDPNGN
ncbi:MAG: PhoH family protein [Eubacteriaceae bacterium]|jgi:phosphate starvation-inducible PhoH-like protein|nr:PhoH family protein [Eubacteriaceae bacterium]